ncbi:MAG: protoporphyrinogen oxidase [Bryobacteraceae bacterium]|nr:protoporphyrinogen oxidase [Bryobacteraceae bacterium]
MTPQPSLPRWRPWPARSSEPSRTPSVVIVGGGISGLSAAYYLGKAGIACTIIEQQPRLGGVIRTEVVDGCLLDDGPDSFLSVKPWAMELVRELGLEKEVIGSNDHLRVTYVLKRGRLVPLPDGLMLMVPTRVLPLLASPLLGWKTKLHMAREFFRRPGGIRPCDVSVAQFVREHFGQEAVDYLAEPLLAGVYGGDAEQLSAASVLSRFFELEQRYGSLTRGVLAERRRLGRPRASEPLFQTLRGGLGRLVEALAEAAGPRMRTVHARAVAVERQEPHYRIRTEEDTFLADCVILACPAWQSAALVGTLDAELAALLRRIPYHSCVTLALGYGRHEFCVPLNGFGFLAPRRERGKVIACTWVGTKFEHRVPEDKIVLRCFLGGGDESILDLSDPEIEGLVRGELRRIMGVEAEPRFVHIARWPRSMAQYAVGHQRKLEAIEHRLERWPGLYLVGNAYYGIGIPDCIRLARHAARCVAGQ